MDLSLRQLRDHRRLGWLAAIALSVKLHVVQDVISSRKRRDEMVTWGLIIGGALLLALGVARLAGARTGSPAAQTQPATPATPIMPLNPAEQMRRQILAYGERMSPDDKARLREVVFDLTGKLNLGMELYEDASRVIAIGYQQPQKAADDLDGWYERTEGGSVPIRGCVPPPKTWTIWGTTIVFFGACLFLLFSRHRRPALGLLLYVITVPLALWSGMLLASLDRCSENVRVLPVVIPELELGNIEGHIFPAHLVERADDTALEDRPEAFNRRHISSRHVSGFKAMRDRSPSATENAIRSRDQLCDQRVACYICGLFSCFGAGRRNVLRTNQKTNLERGDQGQHSREHGERQRIIGNFFIYGNLRDAYFRVLFGTFFLVVLFICGCATVYWIIGWKQ